MYQTQPRLFPERIYEPNIIHNPLTWMGIWTPNGWRVNKKRFGSAERFTVKLNGDGKTTFFPGALINPKTGIVPWQDDLHLEDELFTDHGIYACDPRVEYPAGRPRWAISHTLLCYPYCDHNLYTHEYTWDMTHGHLQTHFRKHVPLEKTMTDSNDGLTVEVNNKPISLTIEANVQYPLCNSAVRGVWDNPEKKGKNYYTRHIVQLIKMHNGVYAIAPKTPVVQAYGMWAVLPDDPIDEVFDSRTGELLDRERLIEEFFIPLDEPKIAMLDAVFHKVPSKLYETDIQFLKENFGVIDQKHLQELQQRKSSQFLMGKIGYAAKSQFENELDFDKSYDTTWDYNEDGIIDDADEQTLTKHLGRKVRQNLYRHAYYGGDWLTTYVNIGTTEHEMGVPAIADYVYGGGYDSQAGIVHLLETPGPNKPVWVEYHHDTPAEAGEDNIVLHLYRELNP